MLLHSSQTYSALRDAIAHRRVVRCRYQGLIRECCPHVIGHSHGRERVLVFQHGGHSSRGLPPGGEWRCMNIDEITEVSVHDGPWRTGTGHSRPQTCVKSIDLEVLY